LAKDVKKYKSKAMESKESKESLPRRARVWNNTGRCDLDLPKFGMNWECWNIVQREL
jgi:hypothetical protein